MERSRWVASAHVSDGNFWKMMNNGTLPCGARAKYSIHDSHEKALEWVRDLYSQAESGNIRITLKPRIWRANELTS
jgi:hypothetical protein